MKRIFIGTICLLALFLMVLPGLAAPAEIPNPAEEAVIAYIESQMPWPQGTARIEILSAPRDWSSLGKSVQLRVEPVGYSRFIGEAAFLVRVMQGRRVVRTETVRTRIEVLRDHVTASRTLRAGTTITEADLNVVQKWVRHIDPGKLSSAEHALGKQLTLSVREGLEILTRLLKEPPLVKKGNMVKIVFDNGPMRIMTSGLSEEDGIAGAIIRVRNLNSNKIIYARVLGDSLVGVEI